MSNLNENTQLGSALTSAFNRREAFLNGGNAAVKQVNELSVIGNFEDFELPECLKELSLQKIFENGYLSDDELEKLKKSHANDNLPLMPTDPTQISPTMHDLLKTSITQSLEDEKKINASIRKKIAEEISLIDTRLERLWECYLDRDIDKAKYELEKQKYLEQKKDLNARVEKYSDISNGLKENIGKAIDFAANLSNLMKAASPDEKNMLLKRLLTNCVLDGEVLKYEIKAPFDKLLVCSNYKKWKDITIENLEEFENLN